jgi:phosphohistidine phosphatase SixA
VSRCDRGFCGMLLVVAAGLWLVPVRAHAQVPGDLPALTVIVRHADSAPEPPDDPGLTAAGMQRAQDLAAALRNTRLSAIITSPFRRARDTAQPIAAALGLTPEVVTELSSIDAHIKAVAAAIRRHPGDAVLVVNHSDVVAKVIAALGGPKLPDICDEVYDHLFALVPAGGRIQLVSSRFGAVSAPPGPDCM